MFMVYSGDNVMTKTDFAELKEKLTKLDDELAIKKQFEKEVTEYRYAVYPDADKDQIQTMLADCGCHGYFDAAFVGVKTENAKSSAIISELIEIIKLQSECMNGYSHDYITLKMNACIAETTTRLQKLRDGK